MEKLLVPLLEHPVKAHRGGKPPESAENQNRCTNCWSKKQPLETALLSANNRYDELNDELDGYKRALKFARNFIETEALEHKNRKSDYKVQQQISNLVAMYQNQLKEVSEENARLAAALGRASANTNKLTTASNSYETSLKSDGRQNANASLIHQGKIASTGAFTWELSR